MWTSTMWMWKRQLSEEEGRKPKLDQREEARERDGRRAEESCGERERRKARGTRSLRGSKLWIGLRGPRVRVNGWRSGDPPGEGGGRRMQGEGWRRIAEAQGEAAVVARGGGWMCGDLVSNHGTTGRASIERAEARPSYPILSFAWNHVGAGVVLVQTNPTQPTGLTLLRLHLRVSTDRPPPPAPSLSTSSFSSSSSPSPARPGPLPSPPPLILLQLPLLLLPLPLLCRYSFATHCYLPPSFASTYCFSSSCLRPSVSQTTHPPPPSPCPASSEATHTRAYISPSRLLHRCRPCSPQRPLI